MTRSQYVIYVIALFLLTAVILFPSRHFRNNEVVGTPGRGFLFGNVSEETIPEHGTYDVVIDYPRVAFESIALASVTAFFSLLCRPRRYAD